MTPPAATATGRSSAAKTHPAREGSPGHRREVRRQPVPRAPRRVSGPAQGRARPAAAPRTGLTLGTRALAVARSLPEHSLIDRLVRGRAWIPVLGVLLAGIVAMQVEMLKLGTSMGRSMELSSTLQSRNESLQASVATLNDDQRIERLATGMGMVMPAPTGLSFLSSHPGGDVGRAIANIHAPDPVGFAAQLAAQSAAAAAAAPASPPSASSTSAPGTSTGTPSAVSSTAATGAATSSQPTGAPASTAAPAGTSTPASTPATTSSQTGAAATVAPATGAAAIAPAGSAQSGTTSGG